MNHAWIDVRERTPFSDEVEGYLVCVDDGDQLIEIAEWHRPRWLLCGSLSDVTADVTHWMPMPNLPESRKKRPRLVGAH